MSMKNLLKKFVLCSLCILCCTLWSQAFSKLDIKGLQSRSWIDGTYDLIARAERLADLGMQESGSQTLLVPAQQQPNVDDQRRFCAYDFARPGVPYFTDATCRAVGRFCYIFVEDAQWQRGTVTGTSVAELRRAFDESTPADPSKGIYEIETENLGPVPDEIDHDPKIYILILDIPDRYRASGTYVAGYFEPLNQKSGVLRDPSTGMKIHSNEVEMIYLDADPLEIGSALSKEILAHELQHMIHWRHDPDEEIWVNEGCSEYAALFLCGYELERNAVDQPGNVYAFENQQQTSLVYWPTGVNSSLANYGAAYLWMIYLHEHYGGIATISALIAQPQNGINGMNSALSSLGYSENFGDIFADWKIANFLGDSAFASGKYGYKSLDLQVKCAQKISSFPVSGISYLQSWAADYIKFIPPSSSLSHSGGSDLQIDFVSRSPIYSFDVRAVIMKDGMPVAVESLNFQVSADSGHISIPDFGYVADAVILVPHWLTRSNADFGEIVSYSYSARIGEDIKPRVVVLPNAVHQSYLDIIVQFDQGNYMSAKSVFPKVTVKRLGRTLVNEQDMIPIFSRDSENKAIYVYQLYIPQDWDSSEVEWSVTYMGQLLSGGDLRGILADKKKAKS